MRPLPPARPPGRVALRLSITTTAKHGLSSARSTEVDQGDAMKRKSGKAMVDLEKRVTVIHFNVGSGYLTYLEEPSPGAAPRLRSVTIPRSD